jgi:hypothetical protein
MSLSRRAGDAAVAGGASRSLRLSHEHGRHVDVGYGETTLGRYVYAPADATRESPRPYFCPLRTLAGHEVTIFRPHDHVWHKGLSMTMAQLSGQNFWGGPTYVRDRGYVQLPNNGRIVHAGWDGMDLRADRLALTETLQWVTAAGETWIDEERTIRVDDVDATGGWWALDLSFRLRNVRRAPLVFGSPTTEGRPLAGYGGLFWRGPRSFLGGQILAAGGAGGPEMMGRPSPWLAFVGRHDGSDASSTVLFLDQPDNLRAPTKWFVRNEPYACASAAFSFDEEYTLEPDAVLALSYRVVIADGAWSRGQIEAYVADRLPATLSPPDR